MKKKVRKLSLKKTVISSFQSKGIVGGTDSFRRRCEPIDLSLLETCTGITSERNFKKLTN